jgi:hypothetical protein
LENSKTISCGIAIHPNKIRVGRTEIASKLHFLPAHPLPLNIAGTAV